MHLKIANCNSISEGDISIEEKRLNIKYAFNGIGKSTIAAALKYSINKDTESLLSLTPFKYQKNKEQQPAISGNNNFNSIAVFDEKYINQFLFNEGGELLKNSFEVFIKTPTYDKNIKEIESLVRGVKNTFQKDADLDSFIDDMNQLVGRFGKKTATGGFSASSGVGKAASIGNLIANIPDNYTRFKPYIENENRIKWLGWKSEGIKFLDLSDFCPYCASEIKEAKEEIKKFSDLYDKKDIEHLSNLLNAFEELGSYLSENAKKNIKELSNTKGSFSAEQRQFLCSLRDQSELLRDKLNALKLISFESLKDINKVLEELEGYRINLDFFPCFNTDDTRKKTVPLNKELDKLFEEAGKLQGEVNKQKDIIKRTIDQNNSEINGFLQSAGYSYRVTIQADQAGQYKIYLRHKDYEANISNVSQYLSYGERNAFALLLFMYEALRKDPDLIILDDPISSFDGNKRFALLNMLFINGGKFKEKTVLFLTHDFNTIIDAIYTLKGDILPVPEAFYLENKKGILTEKKVAKENIYSCLDISKTNMESATSDINKYIYLRKICEIQRSKELEWQLLSSLFHKSDPPTVYRDGEKARMTSEELTQASTKLGELLGRPFVYSDELAKVNNIKNMISLYRAASNNYEKLQIYRIINNENSENKIVKKFVNEVFHIENDNLFQLNPKEYEIIPEYIIEICEEDIDNIEKKIPSSQIA